MTVVRAGEPHEPADVVARPWHCAAEASPFARRRGFLGKEGQVVAEPAADGRSVLLNVVLARPVRRRPRSSGRQLPQR